MHKIALVLACLACAGHSRRVQFTSEKWKGSPDGNSDAGTADSDSTSEQGETIVGNDDEKEDEEDEEEKQAKLQEQNQLQINSVRESLDNNTVQIDGLISTASSLSEGEVPSETTSLQEALANVEQAQKEAYVLEALVTKDKRILENLSGLSDDDSKLCKDMIAGMGSLTEKVNKAKRQLIKSKRDLSSKVNVKQAIQNVGERVAPIDELARRASELIAGELPVDTTEMAQLKDALSAVRSAHKEALDFEKYLGRDKRALDKRSGLSSEDIKACKEAVKDMDALEKKVESAKSSMAGLRKKLEIKMQIKKVSENTAGRTAPVDELGKMILSLAEDELPVESTDAAKLQEVLDAAQKAQQETAKFEKAIAQDRSVLDKLSELPDDDEQARKQAISGMDALVEQLDKSKPSLADLQRKFKGKLKLKQIQQNIIDRTTSIDELGRAASALGKGKVPSDEAGLQEALSSVEKAQKDALYLGEYLVQDLIAVDKLSGLSEEDRQARKKAILDMNALADQVDTAKGRLAEVERKLKSKMKKAR